jgi:hypothetical protein
MKLGKMTMAALLAFICVMFVGPKEMAQANLGFGNQPFVKVFYFEHGGKGSANGLSAGNAAAIADKDLMSIEAGMVIEEVSLIIDTAVGGSSALDVGDDDDADGFCPNASLTLGTPALYCDNAGDRGAYMRKQTQGGSTPNVVAPKAKYYAAAGKEVKLDVTGASNAGKFRVVVKGYKAAY